MIKFRLKVYKDVWFYLAQSIEEKLANNLIPKIIKKISSDQ